MNWLTQPLTLPDGAALIAAWRSGREGAWREWAMWPVRELVACAAVLFTLSAFGVWLLWPSSDQDMDQLTLAHHKLQAQVQTQRQSLSALKSQTPSTADSTQAMSAAQQAWPTPAQVQPVLMALHLQAQKQGLLVESFKPEGALTSQGFAIQPLRLRLRGSFAQLVAWSDAVFQQGALWVPEQWTLTALSAAPSVSPSVSPSGALPRVPPAGQVALDAVLHLYMRPGEGWAPQALAMDETMGQQMDMSGQTDPQPLGAALRLDPFSRPAPPDLAPPSPQPLDDDVHPLRRWPLSDLMMVGSFTSSGVPYALVQTPVGLFHVAMGDMLGAEGARVVDLDDTQLNLRMRVKQENGRSTERQVRLAVRRAAKP